MNISPIFKKIVNRVIIISVVGIVLYCLFLVGCFLFMITGGIAPEMPIPAEALMHKSKAEILEIAFAEDAPRNNRIDNEVNICVRSDTHRWINCMRFKDIEDALPDERLKNSNDWYFYPTKSLLSAGTHYWRVKFKDDKVVEVEKSEHRDSF